MLIFRTTCDTLVDLYINHPDVRPTVEKGDHILSSMSVLTDYRNICYAGEGGCVLFMYKEPGIYEGHVFLLPNMRGAAGLAFGKAALEALKASIGATKVRAAIPMQLPAARWYVRRLGFVSTGRDSGEEFFEMEIF